MAEEESKDLSLMQISSIAKNLQKPKIVSNAVQIKNLAALHEF